MKNLLFKPLSKIFEAVSKTRQSLYRNEILKAKKLDCKTISVGNITVGGTGKTPLVAFIAEVLAENNEKVCILTRGYGRENSNKRVLVSDGKTIFANVTQSGDEPLELAEKLLGFASVIADKKRFEAGKWAIDNLGITAFILDDGFQHIQLKRDLDIVCIDATNTFGNGNLLPAGILRESLENLKRANAIVITRANLAKNLDELKSEISKYTDSPIFISKNKIVNKSSADLRYFAFCGLGNPHNFFDQLEQDGFDVVATKAFRDHHKYTQEDVSEIEKVVTEKGADILLTTSKDAVKLRNIDFSIALEIIESRLVFDEKESFKKLICG